MPEKNSKERMRQIDPERLRQFEHEVEMDRLFYIEFEKNIMAIENHEHYIGKCLDFISNYGVPICNIRTLSGEMMTISDMYNYLFNYFEANEDYEAAAKLMACEEMPERMPLEKCTTIFSLLKQYFIDSTMMMSYEESMIKVQQKMIDTTEFFGLEKPHDYVKVMDRVVAYHRGKLDYDEMRLLEAIRGETIEFYEMEKADFAQGKDRTYFFYSPPEESKK